MPEDTLFPEAKTSTVNTIDPLAKDFLKVYYDYQNTYQYDLNQKRELEDIRDTVALTDNPTVSNKRTNTSLAHKITYNILKQLDIPNIKVVCGQMSEGERLLTQSLFEDALEKAGWRKTLTDRKNGAFKEYISTGDSIIGFGTNPSGKFPFTYWNCDFTKIAVNTEANQMFNPGSEKEVRKMIVVKEYQNSQLFSMWKDLEGKVTIGALPTIDANGLNAKETEMQKQITLAQRTEYAYAYDIDYLAEDGERGLYMTFCGKNMYVHKNLSGKNYPWRDRDGNPTKPYGHLVCFTKVKGFVGYGILQIVYKLGEMHRTLTNMGITYTLSNTNPVRIVATTQSESEFAGNFSRAQRRAKEGKVPIMVNKDGKEFGGVSTLQSNPIINELNAVLALIEKDLMQMGFNLNDISTDTQKTLGALQLEVAASTSLVTYIQKENSHPLEVLLQMFVQALKERKKDDSDIKLACSASVRDFEGKLQEIGGVPEVSPTGAIVQKAGKPSVARSFNLQDLKEIFIKFDEIDIEVSGGVQNNPVLEDQMLRDIIATSDPTSKASAMARGSRARRQGFNFRDEDFAPGGGMPQPAQPAQQLTQPALA